MALLLPSARDPLLRSEESEQTLANSSSPPGFDHSESERLLPSRAISEESKVPETDFRFRVAAAMFSFVVLGSTVSTIGVMVPHLERYYRLNDFHISIIFLAGPLGYIPASQLNTFVHRRLGQRGIAAIGPAFSILFPAVAATHPPFPLLLASLIAWGFGEGLIDGSWCAWAGALKQSSMISGFLHGSFSLGAAAGPFLASTMISRGHRPWYEWYYALSIASIAELIILVYAFRYENAERYLNSRQGASIEEEDTNHMKAALTFRATWMAAAYLLTYVGTETTISGWIVTFMARARHASPYLASLCSSGFWAGMAVGRVALGLVSEKIGVARAATAYLLCGILLQFGFAIAENAVLSAVLMSFVGFFMGPLFPSSIIVLTQRLPRELHVAVVSFVASLGQIGGALLPYGLGVLIEFSGIRIFQVMILAQLTLALVLWISQTVLYASFSN